MVETNRCILFLAVLLMTTIIAGIVTPADNIAANKSSILTQIASETTDFHNNDSSILEVHPFKAVQDSTGYYHIRGEVLNAGNHTLLKPKVSAQLYNKDDNLIGTAKPWFISGFDLSPQQSGTFDLLVAPNELSGKPASYRLSFTLSSGQLSQSSSNSVTIQAAKLLLDSNRVLGTDIQSTKSEVTIFPNIANLSISKDRYDPDPLKVKKGNVIQVTNEDSVPRTVTNDNRSSNELPGKLFNTGVIEPGQSARINTSKLPAGGYPFRDTMHPKIMSTLKIDAGVPDVAQYKIRIVNPAKNTPDLAKNQLATQPIPTNNPANSKTAQPQQQGEQPQSVGPPSSSQQNLFGTVPQQLPSLGSGSSSSLFSQQPNYPPPTILSQYMYVNSIGNTHIVGEVMNQAPIAAKFMKIIVTFYNAYNQVVGTDFTYTDFDTLYPGQRSPFDLVVLSSSVPLYLVRTYTLSVDWEPVQ